MTKRTVTVVMSAFAAVAAMSALAGFDRLDLSVGNLATLSEAKSRSVSPENKTGEAGRAAMAVPSETVTQNVNNASRCNDLKGFEE